MATTTNNTRTIFGIIIVVILAIAIYSFMTMPDDRTTGERMGDAVDELSEGNGLDDAARELEDRTPGERVGDAIEDTGDEIREQTDGDGY